MICKCGHPESAHFVEIAKVDRPIEEGGTGGVVIIKVEKARRGHCGRCLCERFEEVEG